MNVKTKINESLIKDLLEDEESIPLGIKIMNGLFLGGLPEAVVRLTRILISL